MENLNVEEIINGIKKEIQDKGYTAKDLSFEDETGVYLESNMEKFSFKLLDESVKTANRNSCVNWYQPLCGNKIIVFVKKVIRKINAFLVASIVEQQNKYNIYTSRSLSQMECFIKENAELHKEILELEVRLNKVEAHLKKIEGE